MDHCGGPRAKAPQNNIRVNSIKHDKFRRNCGHSAFQILDAGKDLHMKILMAVFAVALLTMPAHAQGARKGKGVPAQSAEAKEKQKKLDKDYRDALDKIPVSTDKQDPWKTMR